MFLEGDSACLHLLPSSAGTSDSSRGAALEREKPGSPLLRLRPGRVARRWLGGRANPNGKVPSASEATGNTGGQDYWGVRHPHADHFEVHIEFEFSAPEIG